jgi:uncharacterized protein YqeY
MSILDTINANLIHAQKAKDELTTSTLRLLKSAIQYASIEKNIDKPDDELVLAVIQKQAKQRKDSIQNYADAGRDELKQKEEAELTILEGYLPAQLSDDNLTAVINETIAEIGARSKKDMGAVMKAVLTKVQGQADGKRVSRLVNTLLP